MLTQESLNRIYKQNAAFGLTGKHVHGRGSERTDGSFTDESPAKQEQPEPKVEGPK